MLKRQEEKLVLSGGLESKHLKPWHVQLIQESKVRRFYFAFDTHNDLEPLIHAGEMLREGGIGAASHRACCYVLIGYPGDSFAAAEKRLLQTVQAVFMPYAMLFRNVDGATEPEWRRFQRDWVRPQYVGAKMRQIQSK